MPICPVCNGLAMVDEKCLVCGRPMVDGGVLRDYYDNYSAYLEQDLYEDGYSCYDDSHCVHLFACPHCHYDTRLRFKKLAKEWLMD